MTITELRRALERMEAEGVGFMQAEIEYEIEEQTFIGVVRELRLTRQLNQDTKIALIVVPM